MNFYNFINWLRRQATYKNSIGQHSPFIITSIINYCHYPCRVCARILFFWSDVGLFFRLLFFLGAFVARPVIRFAYLFGFFRALFHLAQLMFLFIIFHLMFLSMWIAFFAHLFRWPVQFYISFVPFWTCTSQLTGCMLVCVSNAPQHRSYKCLTIGKDLINID